jgi:hypothetical protein
VTFNGQVCKHDLLGTRYRLVPKEVEPYRVPGLDENDVGVEAPAHNDPDILGIPGPDDCNPRGSTKKQPNCPETRREAHGDDQDVDDAHMLSYW